jgi:hypothetical protein
MDLAASTDEVEQAWGEPSSWSSGRQTMPITLCPENQYSPQLACPLRILQSSIIAYALADVAYALVGV